jgi:hypothetical protein
VLRNFTSRNTRKKWKLGNSLREFNSMGEGGREGGGKGCGEGGRKERGGGRKERCYHSCKMPLKVFFIWSGKGFLTSIDICVL